MALRGGPLKLRFNEGIFREAKNRMSGARPFGSFWEGGYPTFAKRDSPEGAKHGINAHTEATQETSERGWHIADEVRSYAGTRPSNTPTDICPIFRSQ